MKLLLIHHFSLPISLQGDHLALKKRLWLIMLSTVLITLWSGCLTRCLRHQYSAVSLSADTGVRTRSRGRRWDWVTPPQVDLCVLEPIAAGGYGMGVPARCKRDHQMVNGHKSFKRRWLPKLKNGWERSRRFYRYWSLGKSSGFSYLDQVLHFHFWRAVHAGILLSPPLK